MWRGLFSIVGIPMPYGLLGETSLILPRPLFPMPCPPISFPAERGRSRSFLFHASTPRFYRTFCRSLIATRVVSRLPPSSTRFVAWEYVPRTKFAFSGAVSGTASFRGSYVMMSTSEGTAALKLEEKEIGKPTQRGTRTICENELEEQFVAGWGKGGQKVNKTSNCVILRHIPTGLQIKCHDTRSREMNRKIARKRLARQLDLQEFGKDSVLGLRMQREKKRKQKKAQRARKKYHAQKIESQKNIQTEE